MIPDIASRATASTKESVQHRQWAVGMTFSMVEERIGGVGRLFLENVETRSRDPSFLQGLDQRGLVDDRSARDIDQIRGRLHQTRAARHSASAASRLLSRQATTTKSELLEKLFETAEVAPA